MSLLQVIKKRIILDIIRSVNTKSKFKIMITDEFSLKILSSVCTMTEIMKEQVNLVESIKTRRQPLPDIDAIYLLSPIKESAELLIQDFEEKQMYAGAHVFFTSPLDEKLESLILQKKIGSYVRISRNFKDANLELIPFESQAFHLMLPNILYPLYEVPYQAEQILDTITTRLFCLFSMYEQMPIIRTSNSDLARRVGAKLHNKLKIFQSRVKNFPPRKERSVMIIFDRSYDPVSPLLHEFTYQAMVYDNIQLVNDKYQQQIINRTGNATTKEVSLDEKDSIWKEKRHKHIAMVIQEITTEFNNFLEKNQTAKFAKGHKISLKEMSDVIRQIPQYQEQINAYSLHLGMTEECMKFFDILKLEIVATLEQNLVMGVGPSGKPLGNIVQDIKMAFDQQPLTEENRLRILLLYAAIEGKNTSEFFALKDAARISGSQRSIITNYVSWLKISSEKIVTEEKRKIKKNKSFHPQETTGEEKFELSRYEPPLVKILEQTLTSQLDSNAFPFIDSSDEFAELGQDNQNSLNKNNKTKTSLRSERTRIKPTFANKNRKERQKAEKEKQVDDSEKDPFANIKIPRIILFFVGGCSYSELRTIYEISSKRDVEIILGTTSMIKPSAFLSDLKKSD
ncbi:protein rop [Anaeramoeba ignava]|uniref:Protein rop n=1 Tax=Anaeramoeba ignava TaxID=1746090 RepID=A0A9Q0LR63_ANAIG|nr:protein rop [Anaeramoeba ignava]